MPCTPILNQEGRSVGIICSRSTGRSKRCACGRPAELLCDYPLAKKDCDAGVCDRCGLHIAYREPLVGGLHTPESFDYCAAHAPFVFPIHERRIIVVNAKSRAEAELVDRTTPLGNPYKLQHDTPAARAACLQRYRSWLWEELKSPRSDAAQELQRLVSLLRQRDVYLRCHCAPKPCHAQVIAKAMLWKIQQEPLYVVSATT